MGAKRKGAGGLFICPLTPDLIFCFIRAFYVYPPTLGGLWSLLTLPTIVEVAHSTALAEWFPLRLVPASHLSLPVHPSDVLHRQLGSGTW